MLLITGAPAPRDTEDDLLKAQMEGAEAHDTFVQDRLVDKTKSFHSPIKKMKLKTFTNLANAAKITNKSQKTNLADNCRGECQLVLLALDHEIDMSRVLSRTSALGPGESRRDVC